MAPEGTLSESASTAVCPAKRLVTRSTTTGSGMRGSYDATVLRRQHPEELTGLPDSGHQRVDVVDVVIDVERRPCGRRHSQATHQRLGAMMARANTDAVFIQDRREIVRVNVTVREWHDARAVTLRSVDRDAFDLREPLDRYTGQLLLVCG